jgi:selenocysteine lyase/cysteine desulfurase
MNRMGAYKVRPAGMQAAHRFETGTPSFEGQAGVLGTIDYLEWLGGEIDRRANSRRTRLLAAMTASAAYEQELGDRLLAGLAENPGSQALWPRPW